MDLKRILIINPFGIGDVLFTTPVIKALKRSLPDSLIGYWCNARVAPILESNPRLDRIYAISRGDIKKIYRSSILSGTARLVRLFTEIRKGNFDISLDFSLDHRYSLISKYAKIHRRIGYNFKERGRFLTDKIDIEGYQDRHIVEYYLELLQLISVQPADRNMELYIPERQREWAEGSFREWGIESRDLVIGMVPGAGESWGGDAALKHWPAANFAQLGQRIIKDFGARVLILGDERESPIAHRIVQDMKYKPIDLTGRTDLAQLSAVIDKLDILVTNDGGPLHMAAALGKKTVSFFGPVDPRVYGPYPPDEKRHIVLRKELECSPCYARFRLPGCSRNRECLEKIDVAEALNAVARLLEEKG